MTERSEKPFSIRPVAKADADTWERLRCDLWPDGSEDHRQEIDAYFAGTLVEPEAVFLAETADGIAIAVMELFVRTGLAGYEGQRIGYVEGLYVVPAMRGSGVAVALMKYARAWAQTQGCTGFASDRAGRLVIDSGYSIRE